MGGPFGNLGARSEVAQKLLCTCPRCSAWALRPSHFTPTALPACPRAAGEGRGPPPPAAPSACAAAIVRASSRRRRGRSGERWERTELPHPRASSSSVPPPQREQRGEVGRAAQREEGSRLRREEGGGYGGEWKEEAATAMDVYGISPFRFQLLVLGRQRNLSSIPFRFRLIVALLFI